MVPQQSDSIRLFRFRGIQVYLHWIWFVWAIVEIYNRQGAYSSIGWNIAEYLSLFVIVLIHEFGHAFACRQTGGTADKIVLWPLGGVAFVRPPPRAGAELWSIAAGPLVNVVLFPVLMGLVYLSDATGLSSREPDVGRYFYELWWINRGLLIFNLLPIYPLDGGQILRSLLWFKLGRAQSLKVAAWIGLIGIPVLALYALSQSRGNLLFIVVMAYFLWQNCRRSLQHANTLRTLERLPTHDRFKCPTCGTPPPRGPIWLCPACKTGFDPFATRGVCPQCNAVRTVLPCLHCGTEAALERWEVSPGGRWGSPPIIDV